MAKVVIFGILDTAQLAKYYLEHDSGHEVIAFTVHQKYIEEPFFEDKPVVPFEDVEYLYPPKEFKFFAPMTGAGMNKKRETVYLEAKRKGYEFISYISSRCSRFTDKIGENCFILEDNTLQPYTSIGNNVVMWSGNHFGHHGIIHDNVFITSHVVIAGHCVIQPYSWLAVNSSVRDGITVSEGTLVGMNACITKNTDPWSVYLGVPAKKIEGKSSMEANP